MRSGTKIASYSGKKARRDNEKGALEYCSDFVFQVPGILRHLPGIHGE
jgi:hypothetical protein